MPATPPLKRTLLVFVKAPVPGEVKTRFIPYLTAAESAELYRCFTIDILRNVSQLTMPVCLQVAYQPHTKAPDVSWTGLKPQPKSFHQEGHSLGERLTHAFGQAFGHGSQQVVIIGSDSPTLPRLYVEQAFAALNEGDVVLGPARNGGYYLIGLSRPCLKLFDDVTWSSDHVFERTAQNAQRLGYALKILPSHYYIDTVPDLDMLRADLAKDNAIAPCTRRFFDSVLKTKPLPIGH